ncbi:MAG: AraC family transcriptional regulator [Ginsengibacter sp.]
MIVLSYPGESYEVFLKTMATSLGASLEENKLVLPASIGEGYMQLINLPMDIQALISDFSIDDDVYLIRQRSFEEFYNLRLEVIQSSHRTELLIDEEVIETTTSKGYAYLSSSLFTLAYKARKGMKVRSLNLRFSKKDIESITGFTDENELLSNSVTNNVHKDRIITASMEMLTLLNEIIQLDKNDPNLKLKMLNRSLYFSELFFKGINSSKQKVDSAKVQVTKTDFDRIREVEKIIIGSLDQLLPKQQQLATKAHMSVSKLKYIFKAVHGTSIYNYYQKARMEKSLELLQDGKTVTETAYELGYSDLSNFTRTFKKQFNLSPGSIKNFSHS